MKLKNILSALLISAIVSAICFAQGADKVDLKLRLKAGESHEMKTTKTQNTSQTANGQEQKMKSVQEMVTGLNVLSVDANGNIEVELVYKSIKTATDGPMGHTEFDSTTPKPVDPNRPDQKMQAAIFSAMAGSKFQMKMKPTGEPYDIRGFESILARMKEKMGTGPEGRAMSGLFDQIFGEKQAKEMVSSMMKVFPSEPIAAGGTWQRKKSVNFIVPMDVNTTYVLKQHKNGIAYIDSTTQINMDSSKALKINNKMSMQLAGTEQTSSEVDETTGLTRRSNSTVNFSGKMKIEANQQMPQGMEVPMTIQSNEVYELIK